ncbi:MAG: cobalt ECF transporter T component CbiQ [Candidatus Micrarchaeota archaeon]
MEHSFIDRYSKLDSPIHRLNPKIKILSAILFIVAVVTIPARPQVFAFYFVVLLALMIVSTVPLGFIFRRSLMFCPFVLVPVLFSTLMFTPGEAIGSYGVGHFKVTVTYDALNIILIVFSRAWLSILASILLVSTTGFSNLLKGLQTLGVPRVITMVMSFMYRYMFVLTDELMRMRRARESRCFRGGFLETLRSSGSIIGSLFIRSYERGERVYAAMLSRGFTGNTRTVDSQYVRTSDVGSMCAFSLIIILNWLWGIWA